jgi:hypothetical protein
VWLKAHPVNSTYVQYPSAEANAYDTAFPASERTATWGGSWEPIWEDSDKVFWRSGGTLDAESDRANGLQGYLVGTHGHTGGDNGHTHSGIGGGYNITSSGSGAILMDKERSGYVTDTGYASVYINNNSGSDDNHPTNRRFIIWKRTA